MRRRRALAAGRMRRLARTEQQGQSPQHKENRLREPVFFRLFATDWLGPGVGGLHLGQDDGDPPDNTSVVVGRSTHDLEQVRVAATDDRIAMLGFGPVRATHSKDNALPARGFELLAQAVAQAGQKPVVAIGGLTADDLESVHQTGAHAAAVIRSVWSAPDPAASLRHLVHRWNTL